MDYYKTRYKFDSRRKYVWKAICEYLQKFILKNSIVLDFGAGYCDFINQIDAAKKIAIDINPESKRYCNKNVLFYNSLTSFKKKLVKLDVIFMSNLLEHLDNNELDKLFSELNQITKKNATIIIIQPNYYYSYREYWDDYTHKKAFSHISISDFLNSKGYKIQKVEKVFLPFTMQSYLPKSYLLTKLYLSLPFRPIGGQMLVIAQKG